MKLKGQESFILLSRTQLDSLRSQAAYRAAMCVTEVMVWKSSFAGETGYYICPRCHITLEREFESFCDRCGQHLDWKDYKKARVIYPSTANYSQNT